MRLRHGVPDEHYAHRNCIPNAGTRLPASASIWWVRKWMLHENRIPIHYIKRQVFWGGQKIACHLSTVEVGLEMGGASNTGCVRTSTAFGGERSRT